MTNWTLAARAAKMNPSAIREILKLTDKPGIISLAGGLPSPKAFPLQEFTAACNTVMARDGAAALQYATSEGFAPLRQAVADMLPWAVDPDQVLITTGSQQALDLIGKVFLDKDSRMLVETPTYLGALQAFAPQEPLAVSVASDDDGILVDDFAAKVGTGADKARLAYVLPNFQNPTGRTMSEARRAALVAKADELGVPLVEDNPYGDLWFEQAPALPLEKIFAEAGRNSVFDLEIDDNGTKTVHPVIIWDVQYHPYKKEFSHIDYYGVDLEKPITVDVPVEFVGVSRGVKLGGQLETFREIVRLSSKPLEMPKKIVVDISSMDINTTICVADLELPENVKAVYDQNFAIVSVISKAKETAEAAN